MQIYDNLPDDLRQGLFQTPRHLPVIVRYSTSPSDIAPDSVAAFRGMVLKVIGVTKQNLSPEPDEAVTQDFLLVDGKAFPAADIAAFRKQILLLEKATQQPEELQTVVTTAARAGSAALRAVGIDTAGGAAGNAKPETHILGETFATTAPLRYGDYIAKLSLAPVSENLKALTGEGSDDAHRRRGRRGNAT